MSFYHLLSLLWIVFEVNGKYYILKTKDKGYVINVNGSDLKETVERYCVNLGLPLSKLSNDIGSDYQSPPGIFRPVRSICGRNFFRLKK